MYIIYFNIHTHRVKELIIQHSEQEYCSFVVLCCFFYLYVINLQYEERKIRHGFAILFQDADEFGSDRYCNFSSIKN